MNREQGKAYLLDTITAAFHADILPEVKLNIKELHDYFDNKGETYRALLDVISEYDSNRITKNIIKDTLIHRANRTEEETEAIILRITDARKMNSEEVDLFKSRFRNICYQTFIENARIKAGDDLVKYTNLVSTYKYKDLGTSDFVIKDLADLDTTELTEKYLNNPIQGGYEMINNAFAGRNGYLRSSLGIVCGRPKSGKSMFLMSEATSFALNGYKVHYLALGDLNELDFLIRMSAIHCGESLEMVTSDVETYKKRMIAHFKESGGSVTLTSMPAGKLAPSEFYNIAVNRLQDYDVLIIDYDLNFKMTSDNMYERGGELYDLLTEIKSTLNCLILIATQPNKAFWNEAFLDDTCFIESSKKSMIVDFAITIGKGGESGTHCGYINVPINRRGSNPNTPYIMVNTGALIPVSEVTYGTYNHDETKRDFSLKEVMMLNAMSK